MNELLTNQNTSDNQRRGWTSASNAQADSLCPGRHLAQRAVPVVASVSKDTEHGRKIHEALKLQNPDGLTVEQRDIYDSCLAIEAKLINSLFPQIATSKAQPKVWREERFWVRVKSPDGQIFEHSGQPDSVFRLAHQAAIFEYKTLAGDVPESPTNQQLRDQAVLVRGNLFASEVAVAVIQPLVTHSPEVCYYTEADMARAEAEMYARVAESNDPKSERRPGELQCRFCLAKRTCHQYQQWAGQTVPNMLSLLDVPVAAWTPQQRAMFLDRRDVAQKWLDDCADAIKLALAEDPNAVDGWMLKPGAVRETVNKPQECFDRFSGLGGSVEQFMKCVTVKKTELKEQLNKVTGARGKALDAAMKTLTAGLVDVKRTAPTLERKVEEKK
jgi:Protein of unknown function (DUF2800)